MCNDFNNVNFHNKRVVAKVTVKAKNYPDSYSSNY